MSDKPRVASRAVMEALDLPHSLQAVQNAYWMAQHEWEKLDEAYRIVVSDMLKRLPDPEDA
jgi:hypothetical protein